MVGDPEHGEAAKIVYEAMVNWNLAMKTSPVIGVPASWQRPGPFEWPVESQK
jgi:hypothetical protein